MRAREVRGEQYDRCFERVNAIGGNRLLIALLIALFVALSNQGSALKVPMFGIA